MISPDNTLKPLLAMIAVECLCRAFPQGKLSRPAHPSVMPLHPYDRRLKPHPYNLSSGKQKATGCTLCAASLRKPTTPARSNSWVPPVRRGTGSRRWDGLQGNQEEAG
jgi:hypothetical protein